MLRKVRGVGVKTEGLEDWIGGIVVLGMEFRVLANVGNLGDLGLVGFPTGLAMGWDLLGLRESWGPWGGVRIPVGEGLLGPGMPLPRLCLGTSAALRM